MRLFVRLVERQSFTAAAADLGIPRSTASEVLRSLESRLGSRLLDRTTRHVTPTLDGEDYYRRCVASWPRSRKRKPRCVMRGRAACSASTPIPC
ncbi:DNA-binding transcriptional LysR family regulator [Bradyrhizobium diazoefficiens]